MKKELKIYLASPRGFCAGVKRATEIVENQLINMVHQFMSDMKLFIISKLLMS